MAHECPDCGSVCYCGGDIDDIEFDGNDDCTHYKNRECSGHRECCDDANCPCKSWGDDDSDLEVRP